MFIDSYLLLSDAQVATTLGASTNTIDFTAIRQIGEGNPMAVVIQVDTAAATTGTYNFGLQFDDSSSFSSPTTVISRLIDATTSLTAGKIHVLPLPTTLNERHMRLFLTTTATASITYTAWLTPMEMISGNFQAYADGFTISG